MVRKVFLCDIGSTISNFSSAIEEGCNLQQITESWSTSWDQSCLQHFKGLSCLSWVESCLFADSQELVTVLGHFVELLKDQPSRIGGEIRTSFNLIEAVWCELLQLKIAQLLVKAFSGASMLAKLGIKCEKKLAKARNQQIHDQTVITLLVRTHTPSASGSYGRLADKVWVDYEIFRIFYRLCSLDFYFFNITALLFIVQKCISVDFSQLKHILGHVLWCIKFDSHFFMSIPTIRYQEA